MPHSKVWNKLRADWEEVEGMEVINPHVQVEEHEQEPEGDYE